MKRATALTAGPTIGILALIVLLSVFSIPDPVQAQTPIPTGTPIAPDIISNTGSITSTGWITLPPIMEIPEITQTIGLTTLWDIDNFVNMGSVVRTMFTFPYLEKFFQIITPLAAIIVGLALISRRRDRARRDLEAHIRDVEKRYRSAGG